ncbi:MAG TPA: GH3 auxin-responsive promoter family protein, partial [Chitinophagaceae bacterium]|nr:GH3 auxin-responsive promoter family protein [Chitinophagaceae bacterium]
DDKNFDSDGKIVDNPDAKMIHEVEEGKEYALLMSTNAGAWRYILGDTIKFVDLAKIELVITGRTKHFLSLTGEHLSVENMNKAIGLVSDEFNVSIPEFTVAGIPHGTFFAHRWYIATDDKVDKEKIRKRIDENLRLLNDDYATERDSALKEVFVEVLSEDQFMKFMELKGKIGSQHKFPRVMKGKMLEEWEKYLKEGCL